MSDGIDYPSGPEEEGDESSREKGRLPTLSVSGSELGVDGGHSESLSSQDPRPFDRARSRTSSCK